MFGSTCANLFCTCLWVKKRGTSELSNVHLFIIIIVCKQYDTFNRIVVYTHFNRHTETDLYFEFKRFTLRVIGMVNIKLVLDFTLNERSDKCNVHVRSLLYQNIRKKEGTARVPLGELVMKVEILSYKL